MEGGLGGLGEKASAAGELEAEVFAEVAKRSGEDLVKASREKGRPP